MNGGSQSFNVVNILRVLGRWMRMITVPNQSSVPKAWTEFEPDGRMKPSSYRDRVVDVAEEVRYDTIRYDTRRCMSALESIVPRTDRPISPHACP